MHRSRRPKELWNRYGVYVSVGVLSFLTVYVVSFVVTVTSPQTSFGSVSSLNQLPSWGSIPPWKLGAWGFYFSHASSVMVSGSVVGVTGGEFATAGSLRYVPASVLFVSGFYASVQQTDIRNTVAGSMISLGYCPLAIAGVPASTYHVEAVTYSMSISPDAVGSILASVAFPVVFGAVGGFLRSLLDTYPGWLGSD
jgi:hypothetical protein